MALSAQKAEEVLRTYREALKFFGVISEMIDPQKRKEVADEIAEAFRL